MKYSNQQLNEVLLAATPDQLAELHAISEVFDISLDEVCSEVLKLINAKLPRPHFTYSNSFPAEFRRVCLVLRPDIAFDGLLQGRWPRHNTLLILVPSN